MEFRQFLENQPAPEKGVVVQPEMNGLGVLGAVSEGFGGAIKGIATGAVVSAFESNAKEVEAEYIKDFSSVKQRTDQAVAAGKLTKGQAQAKVKAEYARLVNDYPFAEKELNDKFKSMYGGSGSSGGAGLFSEDELQKKINESIIAQAKETGIQFTDIDGQPKTFEQVSYELSKVQYLKAQGSNLTQSNQVEYARDLVNVGISNSMQLIKNIISLPDEKQRDEQLRQLLPLLKSNYYSQVKYGAFNGKNNSELDSLFKPLEDFVTQTVKQGTIEGKKEQVSNLLSLTKSNSELALVNYLGADTYIAYDNLLKAAAVDPAALKDVTAITNQLAAFAAGNGNKNLPTPTTPEGVKVLSVANEYDTVVKGLAYQDDFKVTLSSLREFSDNEEKVKEYYLAAKERPKYYEAALANASNMFIEQAQFLVDRPITTTLEGNPLRPRVGQAMSQEEVKSRVMFNVSDNSLVITADTVGLSKAQVDIVDKYRKELAAKLIKPANGLRVMSMNSLENRMEAGDLATSLNVTLGLGKKQEEPKQEEEDMLDKAGQVLGK